MRFLIPVLFLISFLAHNKANEIDSLEARIATRPDDTIKVYDLHALHHYVLYSSPREAMKISHRALKLSKELNFARGIGVSYKNLGAAYSYESKHDSSLYFNRKAIAEFERISDMWQIAAMYCNIASSNYERGDYDRALNYLDTARTYLNSSRDSSIMAYADNLQGSVYLFRGYYLLATEYKVRARDYYLRAGDSLRMADALRDLGLIFSDQQKYHKALEMLVEAKSIYEAHNDKIFTAHALTNIGNVYAAMDMRDSAILSLEKAKQMALQAGFTSEMPALNESLGLEFHEQGRSEQGLDYLFAALDTARKVQEKYRIASILKNLGVVYADIQQYDLSMKYLSQSLEIADSINAREIIRDIYLYRYKIWNEKGDFQSGLTAYRQYATLETEMLKEKSSKQVAEFEILYQLEKKEQALSLQKAEIELLSRENVIQRQQKNLVIAGIIILLLIASFFIFFLIQRNKKAQILHREREERQQLELDHKKRELASYTLHIAQKNQLLDELKEQVSQLQQKPEMAAAASGLHQLVNTRSQIDRDWENFKLHFEQVHPDFFAEMKQRFPQLSTNDLRLLALHKLNLSSKEIAGILNISPESVKKSRYRLRKKMELDEEEVDLLTLS